MTRQPGVRRTNGMEKRNCQKLVRYSDSELSRVTERARASGRPIARYIREMSLGTVPRVHRVPANDDLVRQLALVGNQLRRLAQAASAKQLPEATEFLAGLDGVLAAIRLIE